jgi:hypothetical protein
MHPRRLILPLACLIAAASLSPGQNKNKEAPDRNKDVKTSDVRLGKTLMGKLDDSAFEGRVVLLEFWGINCPPCMPSLSKASALSGELSPFGLLVVGAHAQKGTTDKILSVAKSRGVNFPVVQSASVTNAITIKAIPHCLLFDHTGQCLYQGHPDSVEPKVRAAVSASLIDAVGSPAPTGSVGGLLSALKRGTATPMQVLRRAVPLAKAGDKGTAEAAERLVEALTARARKQLEEAEKLRESDVLQAHEAASGLASTFKGTPIGGKASALAGELKKSPKMAAELKARPLLEAIRKLDAGLQAQWGDKVDPKSKEFHKVNAATLRVLRQRLEALRKAAPDTSALAQATEIAGKYGVE